LSDPFSDLAKKNKKSSLPPLERVSTHFTASKTSSGTLRKPQRNQAQRVQSQKVKPVVKPVQAKQQQQKQAQAPAYKNEDFQFMTNVDNIGANINITFQVTHIFTFLLPTTDYYLWQRMTVWSQKYEYVKLKVEPSCFINDSKLVHSVVKTIVNILTTLFQKAQAMQAQQNQQQQTHMRKRRF